jgi:hypothetical protein
MAKASVRVDLAKLRRKAQDHIVLMRDELEGRTEKGAAHRAWAARFIAVGGKRAAARN